MRRTLAALALVVAACYEPPPPPAGRVRLYVAPGLPGSQAAELARSFGIAEPVRVDRPDDAEVAWLRDPADALALGPLAASESAPDQPGLPAGFTDPKRRFAPVGAIARVIIAEAGREQPFALDDLRELADPRVRGEVALSRLDRGAGPLLVAALELAYGERGADGWLSRLAANRPFLLESDADVVARVAAGKARFGLVDSLTAGGAAERERLRVVFTDQKGSGCVAIPTALVVLPGAGASARRFSAWLAGPIAEKVLVERAVGLLPLRAEATAPKGMVPVWRLAVLSLDWSALADREPIWTRRLAGWPPPLTTRK